MPASGSAGRVTIRRDDAAATRTSTLRGLDMLVIDLQDIGTRTWTYPAAMSLYALQAAAAQPHLPVAVLDRPEPALHCSR